MSTPTLAEGDRVKFVSLKKHAFEGTFSNIKPGDLGHIVSVLKPGQIGCDYVVQFGRTFVGMYDGEIEKVNP